MGTITATFNHFHIKDDPYNGVRCEVLTEYEDGPQRVRFPDGLDTTAFNDELTEWRLEA